MPEYPLAEKVSIDARMEALAYVMGCVKRAYGEDQIALRNVASLVDGVADAVASDDMQSAVVRGLRLLQVAELDHVVGILRRAAPSDGGAALSAAPLGDDGPHGQESDAS